MRRIPQPGRTLSSASGDDPISLDLGFSFHSVRVGDFVPETVRKLQVECERENASGEAVGPDEVANIAVRFKGCTTFGLPAAFAVFPGESHFGFSYFALVAGGLEDACAPFPGEFGATGLFVLALVGLDALFFLEVFLGAGAVLVMAALPAVGAGDGGAGIPFELAFALALLFVQFSCSSCLRICLWT
jgi:hypothetical protein